MKAMVFAAGQGTRLKPLTDKLPKPLVAVAGRPMIEYPLRLLRHYGIVDVVVNVHHFGAMIEEHLGDGRALGLRITYSKETELLDTGGGLLQARPFLQDAPFIVINSDVLIDLQLDKVIERHRQRRAATTLVLRADPEADRYGSIEIAGDGAVRRFLKYHAPSGDGSGPLTKLMFTGVQVVEPKIFDYMDNEPSPRFGTTTATYPKMLLGGEPLDGFTFDGFWQDLGTVERILEAEARLTRGEIKLHYL